MYTNREQVREIVTKVRTSHIRANKARVVSSYYEKQLATYFHDILAEVIDQEYERIIAEKTKLKRV